MVVNTQFHDFCGRSFARVLYFERSEFLIATCKKKKTDSLCVYVRLILVLVLGRQIVYGQNTVYLCLSKYIVFENTHPHIATAASETEGQAARTAATCT